MGCIITANYMCINGTSAQLLFSLKIPTFLFTLLIKVLGIDAINTSYNLNPLCYTNRFKHFSEDRQDLANWLNILGSC